MARTAKWRKRTKTTEKIARGQEKKQEAAEKDRNGSKFGTVSRMKTPLSVF